MKTRQTKSAPKSMAYRLLLAALLALLTTSTALAQSGPDGAWTGSIDLPGMSLDIRVVFSPAEDGYSATIDIPQQGAFGLPLHDVTATGDSVSFKLAAGPGLAVFRGLRTGDVIAGEFSQAGIRVPFSLKPAATTPDVSNGDPSPGDAPSSGNNWLEKEVDIPAGGIALGCTITRPVPRSEEMDGHAYPAIILITGSGPQDRDETIFGFRPFRILAEHLTPLGYTVLRCDDRGVGKSGGTPGTVTSHDLANDVIAMMDFLVETGEARQGNIGLLGHSEGGIIAADVAARRPDTRFIVSMAGTALPGHEIIRAQSRLIMQVMDAPDDAILRQDEMLSLFFRVILNGSDWDEVEQALRSEISRQIELMPDEQRKTIADPETYLNAMVQQQLAALKSPWYQYFIRHDPAENLRQLRMPVLALFGELDLQVPAEMNAGAMRLALDEAGNTEYTIVTLPGANHLFQKARTGSPAEYAILEKAFIAGFLDTITGWLDQLIR